MAAAPLRAGRGFNVLVIIIAAVTQDELVSNKQARGLTQPAKDAKLPIVIHPKILRNRAILWETVCVE
jgi:hypothetical protein